MTGIDKCMKCNNKQWEHFETVMDNYESIVFYECQVCGMVTQWPQMNHRELQYFYERVYRDGRKLHDLVEFEAKRAEAQFHIIEPEIDGLMRMLDVGCSTGMLLSRFRRLYAGAEYVGSEPNDFVGNYARMEGHSVVGDFNKIVVFTRGFDLITMVHSLEHMKKPGYNLYNLRRLADDDCKLYVEVPNLLGDVALEKAHIHGFTEETLPDLMRLAGWEPIWVKKHGAPKHPTLECYLSVMAVKRDDLPYFGTTSPGGNRRKRKIGMLKRNLAMATYGGENVC
jgi:ubiquinone/menaquinone biosynthesis C-methylase UbiE